MVIFHTDPPSLCPPSLFAVITDSRHVPLMNELHLRIRYNIYRLVVTGKTLEKSLNHQFVPVTVVNRVTVWSVRGDQRRVFAAQKSTLGFSVCS